MCIMLKSAITGPSLLGQFLIHHIVGVTKALQWVNNDQTHLPESFSHRGHKKLDKYGLTRS